MHNINIECACCDNEFDVVIKSKNNEDIYLCGGCFAMLIYILSCEGVEIEYRKKILDINEKKKYN